MCAVAVEGLGAYWYDRRSSAGISDYGVVGRSVGGLLPGGAKVAGSARWAWALRGRDYVARLAGYRWASISPVGPHTSLGGATPGSRPSSCTSAASIG